MTARTRRAALPPALTGFAAAIDAYTAARHAAEDARRKARDAALDRYHAGDAALWAECVREIAEADAERDRAVIAAGAEYDQRLVRGPAPATGPQPQVTA